MNNILNTESYWKEEYVKSCKTRQMENFSAVFEDMFKKYKMISPGKILIIGCDKGYDAVLAAKNGFDVTAIVFSNESIVSAEELAFQNLVKINFLSGDFFLMDENNFLQFNYVFEFGMFNATNSFIRKEYLKKISLLLKPGGKLITLILPAICNEDNHSLNLNIKKFYKEVSEFFKLEFSSKIINPLNNGNGKEILQIYVKQD